MELVLPVGLHQHKEVSGTWPGACRTLKGTEGVCDRLATTEAHRTC